MIIWSADTAETHHGWDHPMARWYATSVATSNVESPDRLLYHYHLHNYVNETYCHSPKTPLCWWTKVLSPCHRAPHHSWDCSKKSSSAEWKDDPGGSARYTPGEVSVRVHRKDLPWWIISNYLYMDSWTQNYLKEMNELREKAIEDTVQVILTKPCPACEWVLNREWKTRFKCRDCGKRFKMRNVPKKPVDPSDQSKWRTTCEDCWKKAKFYKNPSWRMAYLCSCWWCLEV